MEKIKKLVNRETISYLVFGVLTTVVSLVTYKLFTDIFLKLSGNKQVYLSTVLSWIFAVTFAYITNRIFVFKSQNREIKAVLKEISAFFGARVLSLGFEEAWMWITVDLLGFGSKVLHIPFTSFSLDGDFICKIIAQFVVVVLNYIFSKLFIFKKHK
ncbi:MAG: GtrA family protein [Firmicutes bacterium]|nr:GtrA family protein [Bacillota bacterium]